MKRLAILEPGARVDRYVVLDTLGQGGMAVVYRVRHEKLGSLHALKVVVVPSRSIMERLLREGQSQARLHHRNVVQVNDVIEVDGSPGLVMEYVPGPNLEKLLRNVPLDLQTVDRLGRQMLRGIAAAHDAGLVHRDLKPANILCAFEEDGLVPKIADFGLVKDLAQGAGDTRTGSVMGTPNYMSPEQIRDSKSVDHRTDVFSCGAILYELLTRQVAFPGDDLLEVFNRVAEGRFDPVRQHRPDAPDRMVNAIEHALKVRREDRAGSAAALLEQWCDGLPDRELPPVALPQETVEWIRSATLVPPDPFPTPAPGNTVSLEEDEPASASAAGPPSLAVTPKRGWAAPLAGLVTVGLAVGCFGFGTIGALVGGGSYLGSVFTPAPAPVAPSPLPREPEPVAPEPPSQEPVPVPPPEPAAPERPGPERPAPERPAPERPAPERPAPERPGPELPVPPPAPLPLPEPTPAPPPGNVGMVKVGGVDPRNVLVEGSAGSFAPGEVPAGRYDLLVDFGSGPVKSLEVAVVAGKTTRVSCAPQLSRCALTP